MDLVAINDAIETLENASTTSENVFELASLYICQERLKNRNMSKLDTSMSELQDILPYYKKYVDIKTRYQLKQTSESEVIKGIKDVCRELSEFIDSLYSGTDMGKERRCITDMINKLWLKYN